MKLLPLTSFVLLLLAASPSIAQVNIISRNSFVNASDQSIDLSGSPFGPSEMDFFSGEGNFNSTLTANSVRTSQDSTITAAIFEIVTFSDAGLTSDLNGIGTESITAMDVEFEVTSTVSYLLEGLFDEEIVAPDTNNDSSLSVQVGSGGLGTSDIFSVTSFDDPSTQTNFSSSGILLPGIYTFDFISINVGFSTTPGIVSSSEVSLVFSSVPEPSSTSLLGIVALVVGFRRRKF